MTVAVSLAPPPILFFLDNQGKLASGGSVLTQVGGINTATYQDAAGTVALPNPIPLNSRGEISNSSGISCQLFLQNAVTYTFTLFDKDGNQLNQPQTVQANALLSALAQNTSTSVGAGMVGEGILNYPDNTVGGAVITTVFGDGATDKSSDLAAANALGHQIRIRGILVIGTQATLTVPIVDTVEQIFAVGAKVTISNGLPVRPEWWGPVPGIGGSTAAVGMVRYAVNALPSSGGTVKLRNAAYRSGYDTATAAMFNNRSGTPGLDYMVAQHVRIIGEKLGEYNGGLTMMQNGSIIQGTIYISSECTGLHVDLVSVDAGTAVIAALYPSATQGIDGFCVLQCNKTAPLYGVDVHIGSVSALGSGVNTLSHAILLEAISGDLKYAEGVNGWHDIAIKCPNFAVGTLVGRGGFSENVILKSDSYANLGPITIDQIIIKGLGVQSTAGDFGLLVQAATFGGGGVTIGNLTVDNTNFACRLNALTGFTLADVNIGSMTLRSSTFGYDFVGDIKRSQVANAKINALTQTAVTVYAGVNEGSHCIGSLSMANCVAGLANASTSGGAVRVGSIMVDSVSGALFSYLSSTATFLVDGTMAGQGTNGPFSNLTLALSNSWANAGGAFETFAIGLRHGEICLKGVIVPGTSGVICTLPVNYRPTQDATFTVMALNGSTYKAIALGITASTGVVQIVDTTAAATTLSLHGVSWPVPYGSGVLY